MAEIPPGYAQVNHKIGLVGDLEPMLVTLGLKFTTVLFEDLETIANAVYDAWADAWEPRMIDHYTLHGVDLLANIGGNNFVVGSTTAARIGDLAVGAAPQNVAWLIKKRTALGGRTNRGRMYMPGVPETWVGNDGVIVSTNRDATQTACNTWLTALQAITGVDDAVVLHSQGIFDPPTVISSFLVDSRVATQRRRLR